MTFKYVGFEVSNWYVSKTLQQEFDSSVVFEVDVVSNLKKGFDFEKFKSQNIIVLAIQIETTLKGFFEYFAQYQYDVNCSDYSDDENQVLLIRQLLT